MEPLVLFVEINIMKKIILTTSVLLPTITFAAGTIKDISLKVATFLGKPMMVMLFSIALAMFLWGVVDFIRNAENSDEREKGKKRMMWGIVALFAMVAFLGLTNIITQTFFSGNAILPQLYEN